MHITIPAGGNAPYRRSFTASDLDAGVLAVAHNLGASPVLVAVYDNAGAHVDAVVETVDTNSVTVDLSAWPGSITGTWNVVVVG